MERNDNYEEDGIFIKIPIRLINLSIEKDSEITHNHFVLYSRFWERANWQIKPAETGKLSISKLLGVLEWKKRYFYTIFNDLIRYEFIERVYDVGQKRSSLLKIRFLPDP